MTPQQFLLALSLTSIYTVTVLTIASLKDEDGGLPYNTASLVLFVEFVKCVISFGYLAKGSGGHAEDQDLSAAVTSTIKDLQAIEFTKYVRYAVPGLCYCINNNLYYLILANMPAANFQMLQNIRVVMTGVTFRFLLQRMLSNRQWAASFVLLFGCMLGQYHPEDTAEANPDEVVTVFGYTLVAIYLCISVFASVYCELLLKKEPNLHLSNIQLYSWGCIFSIFALIYQGSTEEGGLFKGWDLPHTWAIMILQIGQGLTVSRVMKYLDSIYKLFCSAFSNLAVYLVSVFYGVQSLTAQFIGAFILVCIISLSLALSLSHLQLIYCYIHT